MAATPKTSTAPIRPGGLVRPGLMAPPLPTVELDPRIGNDFLSSLCDECGEAEDLLPEDRRWTEEARAAMAAEFADDPSAVTCFHFATELGRLIIGHPELRTARDVVAAIDAMSDRELLEVLVDELLNDPELGALTRRAVDGDAGAFAELQTRLDSYKGHPVISGPVDELAPAARRVVHAWLPKFEPAEARIGRILQRDAATRRLDEAARDPIGFVERTTNGIRLVPDQRIRKIVLVPSYFGRPYNALAKIGDVQLICYPVADSALGAADRLSPPAATVRLYRALGDSSRLRILRLLAEGDRYLTEIANEVELSKPTVKHHLAQLRAAGLVTVTDQGNLTYYSLRHDRAEEAGVELRAYLAH